MKIRKLVFTNINNLKDGPHIISFDEAPLQTAGIFAIVGPTGAGKSTILDVITLALFNRVPRLPSISDKRIEKDGSIITHFTKKASAAITYQVGMRSYTSKWSIHVAKSGKVQPYHMELLDEGGNIIAERSAVPGRNEAIIGLNYEQFVKSIILSQGDFSRFLKAKKDERSELLEKLTGSQIYRKVGKAAYQKNKEVQESLKNLKSLLSDINIFSDEELLSLQDKQKDASKQAQKIEEGIKSYNGIRTIKITLRTLTHKIREKKLVFAEVSKELAAFSKDEERIKMHDRVSFYSGEIKLYENTKRNIQQTEIAIIAHREDVEKAKETQEKSIAALSELTGQSVNAENFRELMDVYESHVMELESKLINLHSRGSDARLRIKHVLENAKLGIDAKSKPEIAVNQLAAQEKQLVDIIGGFSDDINVARQKLELKRANLSVLQALDLVRQRANGLSKDLVSEKKKLTSYQNMQKHNRTLLEKQEKLLTSLDEQLNLLKKQKEDAIKIAKLEELRDQLVRGQPCPLCGALDHPFSEHFEAPSSNSIDQAIGHCESKIKEQQLGLKNLHEEGSEANTGIKIGLERIKELEKEFAIAQGNIDNEEQKYRGEASDLKQDFVSFSAVLEREIADVNDVVEALSKISVVKDLLIQFKQLNEIGKEYAETKRKKLSLYEGSDVKADCNKLQDLFIKARTSLEKGMGFLAEKEKSLAQFKVDLDSIKRKLELELPKLGLKAVDEISTYVIPEHQYLKLSQKRQELNDLSVSVKAELEQSEKEFKDFSDKDTAPDQLLEDLEKLIAKEGQKRNELNERIGEITSQIKYDTANRKTQEAKQNEIAVLEKEADKWSIINRMIGSASGDKFANFAQDLTLKNLLVYANIRLSDLTDRYLLDMPGEKGALTVIDLYQGNTARTVTTLSGGEIFILSLALAISLSDMASQNIALESLFIDEGFGTLDQETLDVAMSTLEKLQSENSKMIGVISHVEALKERINVQVQLKKNAQGYSRIKVVG